MINSPSSHQCRVAWWSGFFGHVWLAVSPPEVSGHTNRPFRVRRISALHLNDTGTVRCLRKRSKWEDFQGWVPPPPFFFELTYLAYLYVLSEYGDGPLIIRCQQYVSYLLFDFMYVWLHHDLDLENTALSSGSNRAKYGLQNDNALMYIANITSWCYTFFNITYEQSSSQFPPPPGRISNFLFIVISSK